MRVGMALIALIMVGAFSACSADKTLETKKHDIWRDNFAEAKEVAAKRQLPILINFSGSDWCGWCVRLEREVFSQKEFEDYASKSLVLMLADFPRGKKLPESVSKQNEALAKEHGVRGFPTILLLSPEGKVIARTGYQQGGAANYVNHIKGLISQYEQSKQKEVKQ